MEILIMLLCLLIAIVPIVIIVLIIQAVVKRSNKDKKTEFNETIRSIYIYLILIITLIAIIAGVISAFSIGLDILLPEKYASETVYSNRQLEQNENIVNLLTTITLVISALPIFIYHNGLAKQEREQRKEIKVENN